MNRLEYIMLLNLPIILSSNSFLFYLLFPFYYFFLLSFIKLQQNMAALQECSWQWLPIAAYV